MPPKRHLTHMFPHRIILITSLVLCACATGSILLSVLSWTNQLWGYYFRTGIWSGGVILITGMLGILCNYVRSVSTVKAFLIAAIFGVLVSLALVALSAGGLDVKSGFYSGERQNAFLNNICHGISLGVGVLQLTLCILCDGICIYYLFIDNSQMYKVEDAVNHKKRRHKPKRDNSRSSTRSDAPLVGNSSKPKSSKTKKKKRSRSYDDDQDYQVEYRKPARRLEGQTSSGNRSPCIRPSSFSTFGRADAGDRASLIVHPGDTASIADTNRSQTPSVVAGDECHYAQTMLFNHPLPIEEDEELPPYQAVDPHSQASVVSCASAPYSIPLKRTNSAPMQNKKKNGTEKLRGISARYSIPRGRSQNDAKTLDNSFLKEALQRQNASKNMSVIRHSRSADLLNCQDQVLEPSLMDQQGVSCRDFAHSSEKIPNEETAVKRRAHSFRSERSKQFDRKRRALSAEIKVSKEHILSQGQGMGPRTSSIDGSNSGLFASNRIIPTKFSLRTPVRQTGMPHVRSAIPVRSVSSPPPLVSPPPKPPRTFSVRAEDLRKNCSDSTELIDDVFVENNKQGNSCSGANICSSIKNNEKLDTSLLSDGMNKVSNVSSDNTVNHSVTLDSGPVLKFNKPIKNISTPDVGNARTDHISIATKKGDGNNQDISVKSSNVSVIELPISPTIKCPFESVHKSNEATIIYAKIDKTRNKQGVTTLNESQRISSTIRNESLSDATNGEHLKSTEDELVIEDKVSVSVKHTADKRNTKSIDMEETLKPSESEKLVDELEKHQNLQVRIPPLSPSERILKRKVLTEQSEFPGASRALINDTINGNGKMDKEHNGARPKTQFQNRGKETSSSEIPVPKQRKSLQQNNNGVYNMPSSSMKHRYSLPNDKSSRTKTVSPSRTSGSNSRTSLPQNSKSHVSGPSNRHSTSSTSNIPVRTNPGSVMSAHSQGVLHLPQSQLNRHLQTDRQGNAPAVNQPPAANQNQQNRDNDDSNTNALYAQIL